MTIEVSIYEEDDEAGEEVEEEEVSDPAEDP